MKQILRNKLILQLVFGKNASLGNSRPTNLMIFLDWGDFFPSKSYGHLRGWSTFVDLGYDAVDMGYNVIDKAKRIWKRRQKNEFQEGYLESSLVRIVILGLITIIKMANLQKGLGLASSYKRTSIFLT
jgi:hypothetical protein